MARNYLPTLRFEILWWKDAEHHPEENKKERNEIDSGMEVC